MRGQSACSIRCIQTSCLASAHLLFAGFAMAFTTMRSTFSWRYFDHSHDMQRAAETPSRPFIQILVRS